MFQAMNAFGIPPSFINMTKFFLQEASLIVNINDKPSIRGRRSHNDVKV